MPDVWHHMARVCIQGIACKITPDQPFGQHERSDIVYCCVGRAIDTNRGKYIQPE